METDVTTRVPEKRKALEVRPLRGHRTPPWQLRKTIHPTGPVATGADLYAQCGERLARLMLELATWDRLPGGCAVSDTRYLVVSFKPEPKIAPYVQFASAATKTSVLWEVVSLDYVPNLERLLSQTKHAELTRRGFAKGRASPANYAREVTIDDLEAARRVAHAALEILVDIFEYRGLQPLGLFSFAERRAQTGLVYRSLRVDEMELLLCRWGVGARIIGPDVRLVQVPGLDVRFVPGRKVERGAYAEYTATARFAPHPRLTDSFARDWNAGTGLSRLHLEPSGEAVLQLVLPLRHGMSESQIAGMAGDFAAEAETLRAVVEGNP
jgi:hypothetical protein